MSVREDRGAAWSIGAAPPDELSHVPTHAADRDSEGLDRDMAVQANQEQMLEAIEDALERINDGSFRTLQGLPE